MPSSYVDFTFYSLDLKPLWSTQNVSYAEWSRTVNSLGAASVELSTKSHSFQTLMNSRVMTISTNHDRGLPNLETAWFLTDLQEIPMADGLSSRYRMIFEDALTLFDSRIVAFRADFPQGSEPRTRINTVATEALTQVYDVTLGLLAGPGRVLEPQVTTKAAVTTVAPVISKEIPWKRGISTLQQIAQSSRDQGSPIYFDLLARNAGGTLSFLFQTYAGQRGADKSQQAISSSDPLFSLTEFNISYKFPNVGIVGGAGRGLNRLVATVIHPGTGNIDRVETFRAAMSSNQDLLEDEASHLVNNTAGRITLAGRLLGNLGDQYGFGDLVTLEHRGLIVPGEVSSVQYVLDQQYLDRQIVARSIE